MAKKKDDRRKRHETDEQTDRAVFHIAPPPRPPRPTARDAGTRKRNLPAQLVGRRGDGRDGIETGLRRGGRDEENKRTSEQKSLGNRPEVACGILEEHHDMRWDACANSV